MSWTLFIDESGQDRRQSPYEVLAGLAIEDRQLWRLINNLSDAQEMFFGMRLFDAFGKEAKAKELLKAKVFRHSTQMPKMDGNERTRLASEILRDGAHPTRERLTALAQAKIAYCEFALRLCLRAGGKAFASIVPQAAERPRSDHLRKDYAYLFERFYYFLNGQPNDPMGYLVFDELDKSASHILLEQVGAYFRKTRNGRTRSRLIIPEPFFVHSDLTAMVQMADLVAYIVSWGLRLNGMERPGRAELAPLVKVVDRLQFTQKTPGGYTSRGFKLITDLNAVSRQ